MCLEESLAQTRSFGMIFTPGSRGSHGHHERYWMNLTASAPPILLPGQRSWNYQKGAQSGDWIVTASIRSSPLCMRQAFVHWSALASADKLASRVIMRQPGLNSSSSWLSFLSVREIERPPRRAAAAAVTPMHHPLLRWFGPL